MNKKLETFLSVILTMCAVAIAATYLFRRPSELRTLDLSAPPVHVEDWQELVNYDPLRIGSSDAAVQIIEFSDFECPFCKRFHEDVEILMTEFPGHVSLAFFHHPLPYHRFAIPAAKASECAHEQGVFPAAARSIFTQQDSFGITPWQSIVKNAGVDTTTFLRCFNADENPPRMIRHIELGDSMEVQGTPTVIINGWRYASPPSADSVRQIIKEIVSDQSPR